MLEHLHLFSTGFIFVGFSSMSEVIPFGWSSSHVFFFDLEEADPQRDVLVVGSNAGYVQDRGGKIFKLETSSCCECSHNWAVVTLYYFGQRSGNAGYMQTVPEELRQTLLEQRRIDFLPNGECYFTMRIRPGCKTCKEGTIKIRITEGGNEIRKFEFQARRECRPLPVEKQRLIYLPALDLPDNVEGSSLLDFLNMFDEDFKSFVHIFPEYV